MNIVLKHFFIKLRVYETQCRNTVHADASLLPLKEIMLVVSLFIVCLFPCLLTRLLKSCGPILEIFGES